MVRILPADQDIASCTLQLAPIFNTDLTVTTSTTKGVRPTVDNVEVTMWPTVELCSS